MRQIRHVKQSWQTDMNIQLELPPDDKTHIDHSGLSFSGQKFAI